MTLLEINDLHLHYYSGGRVVRAVDGVSFAIPSRGHAVGVVGESGSGKTSLATALMRLVPKNVARFDGSILLDGRDLLALSAEEYRKEIRWNRIAMVFQGAMSVLNPVLKVGVQVAEPLLLDKRVDKSAAYEKVASLLERVGLPREIFSRYPHELSGGQKQRVVIATALVLDPDLLILDEPTSALDVSVQAQIMNLLKDLKADPGISMIFITHDIGLASDLCDDIAVAYAGQHLEFGPAERVLTSPNNPYTRLLLASLPRLHDSERPQPMPGDPPDLTNVPSGCRFHPRCPDCFEKCPREMPPTFPIEAGGHSRCWLALEPERRAVSFPHRNGEVDATAGASLPGAGEAGAPLVSLQHVQVVFKTKKGIFKQGTVRAIDDVSLDIARGETVALVGESGSGKTTLGRVSLRLANATGGSVTFDGREITSDPDPSLGWFRQRAQIVFQDPFSSLNPYMRVRDLIEEPLAIDHVPNGERWAKIAAALESVELVPPGRFAEKYPTMMSGGQRQRVGIARALVRNPDYIVADEPVSMIDASSRIEILDLLSNLQKTRGVSFLYITHDIASARHFANRIAVMYLGTVVEMGSAAAVIDNPLHPYTKALIEAIPEPDPANRLRKRAVVPGEPATAGAAITGCPFFARCPIRIPGTCDTQRPELRERESGHATACWAVG